METLFLNDEIIGYKTTYVSKLSKDELLRVMEDEIKNQPEIVTDAFNLSAKMTEISDIVDFAIGKCSELAEQSNVVYNEIHSEVWANRISAQNPILNQRVTTVIEGAHYHVHTELNKEGKKFIPHYTFVYYVQMPDNLSGVEGALLIKNTKEDVYVFNPKENDLIILDANTPHSPMGSPNSTKDRMVIAGNVAFANIKKQKSML